MPSALFLAAPPGYLHPTFLLFIYILPVRVPPRLTNSVQAPQPTTQQSSSRATARRIQQSMWRHFSFCLGCPALGSVLQLKSLLSSRNTLGSVWLPCPTPYPIPRPHPTQWHARLCISQVTACSLIFTKGVGWGQRQAGGKGSFFVLSLR